MDMGSVAEPTGDGERPLHCRLLQLNKMEHYDRLMKNGKMLEDENKLVAFKLKKLQYNSQIDLRIRKMKSDLKKIIGFQTSRVCEEMLSKRKLMLSYNVVKFCKLAC
ncbi:uncharacterized protein LOC124702194 isoform X2 [Lolium rigidum]|uniref:uncharacterized protein LOC124702194 isoform X2 n=1 Tax=Lolium rigidum TaxID=89674 RepID=UPI001F5D852E|nr:uncharacterized protein LOC124702194 isoform X2 [Lolium rigidum]